MRLMIVILVLVTLVIVDQYRFHGYYTSEVSRMITHMIRSFT
jgi:hypothetical protein